MRHSRVHLIRTECSGLLKGGSDLSHWNHKAETANCLNPNTTSFYPSFLGTEPQFPVGNHSLSPLETSYDHVWPTRCTKQYFVGFLKNLFKERERALFLPFYFSTAWRCRTIGRICVAILVQTVPFVRKWGIKIYGI